MCLAHHELESIVNTTIIIIIITTTITTIAIVIIVVTITITVIINYLSPPAVAALRSICPAVSG